MSKSIILNAVKKNQPTFVTLPEIPDFPDSEENLEVQFQRIAAGSKTTCFSAGETIEYIINTHFSEAKNIVAPSLAAVSTMFVDANSTIDDLKKIDLAILPATLAVSENGALWLAEKDCPHRVLPFITQHLILMVDKNKIVQNMHRAYRQITIRDSGFGVFIAGPSKTADIEQSLVIGAQGARSLGVLLLD